MLTARSWRTSGCSSTASRARSISTPSRVASLARSVVRALGEGRRGEVMRRYLEAWLLRLHGIYPPLDHCSRCAGPLPGGALSYQAASHGFVCAGCGPRRSVLSATP